MGELATLEPGHYLVSGYAKVVVSKGYALITGGRFSEGSEVVVTEYRAVALEVPEGCTVSVARGEAKRLEKPSIPPEWGELAQSISRRREAVVLVFGDVDVGKTYFATYLVNKLLEAGARVAVVDSDIGQSDIGPPATVGMGFLGKPTALMCQIPLASAYFVGSTSPAGHLLPMVLGTKKMVDEARRSADAVVVDTTGMVRGGPARALKLYKVEAVDPQLVVGIQMGGELEHILRQVEALGYEVARLPPSHELRRRGRVDRRAIRASAFQQYFSSRGLRSAEVSLDEAKLVGSFLGTGVPASEEVVKAVAASLGGKVMYCETSADCLVAIAEVASVSRQKLQRLMEVYGVVKVLRRGFEKGLLVGLLGEGGGLLDIGILRELDFSGKKALVDTPLRDVSGVRAIKIGSVRLGKRFEEVERIPLGYV